MGKPTRDKDFFPSSRTVVGRIKTTLRVDPPVGPLTGVVGCKPEMKKKKVFSFFANEMINLIRGLERETIAISDPFLIFAPQVRI